MSKRWWKVVVSTRTGSSPHEFRGEIKLMSFIWMILNREKNDILYNLTSITITPYHEWEDDQRKEYERLKKKFEPLKEEK